MNTHGVSISSGGNGGADIRLQGIGFPGSCPRCGASASSIKATNAETCVLYECGTKGEPSPKRFFRSRAPLFVYSCRVGTRSPG